MQIQTTNKKPADKKVQFSQRGNVVLFGLFLPVAWEIQVLRKNTSADRALAFSSPGQEIVLTITDTHQSSLCAGARVTPRDSPTRDAGRPESEATNPNRTARPRPGGHKEVPRSARRPQPGGKGGPRARHRAWPHSSPGAPPGHRPHRAGERPERRGRRLPPQGDWEANRHWPGPARTWKRRPLPAGRPAEERPRTPAAAYLPAAPAAAAAAPPSLTPAASPPPQPIGGPSPQLSSHWATRAKAGQHARLPARSRVSGASPGKRTATRHVAAGGAGRPHKPRGRAAGTRVGGEKVPLLLTVLGPGPAPAVRVRPRTPAGGILGGSVSRRLRLPGSQAARGSRLRGAAGGSPRPSSVGSSLLPGRPPVPAHAPAGALSLGEKTPRPERPPRRAEPPSGPCVLTRCGPRPDARPSSPRTPLRSGGAHCPRDRAASRASPEPGDAAGRGAAFPFRTAGVSRPPGTARDPPAQTGHEARHPTGPGPGPGPPGSRSGHTPPVEGGRTRTARGRREPEVAAVTPTPADAGRRRYCACVAGSPAPGAGCGATVGPEAEPVSAASPPRRRGTMSQRLPGEQQAAPPGQVGAGRGGSGRVSPPLASPPLGGGPRQGTGTAT